MTPDGKRHLSCITTENYTVYLDSVNHQLASMFSAGPFVCQARTMKEAIRNLNALYECLEHCARQEQRIVAAESRASSLNEDLRLQLSANTRLKLRVEQLEKDSRSLDCTIRNVRSELETATCTIQAKQHAVQRCRRLHSFKEKACSVELRKRQKQIDRQSEQISVFLSKEYKTNGLQPPLIIPFPKCAPSDQIQPDNSLMWQEMCSRLEEGNLKMQRSFESARSLLHFIYTHLSQDTSSEGGTANLLSRISLNSYDDQQQQLMTEMFFQLLQKASLNSQNTKLDFSDLEAQRSDLTALALSLEQDRKKLDLERKNLAAATVRLATERLAHSKLSVNQSLLHQEKLFDEAD